MESKQLSSGIPHVKGETAEKFGEVAFAGEDQLTLDPDGVPLLLAYGLGDSATASLIMDHAACCRMMTPAVPVAIELCEGSAEGEDHKVTQVKGMGTAKGGRVAATTKRVPVLQAACGKAHTIMLKGGEVRGVRVCGDNGYGQLGLGHTGSSAIMTKPVPFFQNSSLSPVVSVAAGAEFSMALLQDGRAFSWGRNDAGQLGLGLLGATIMPLEQGRRFVEISTLAPGCALDRTEKVTAGHRITWFHGMADRGSEGKRHNIGDGDCADESALGVFGILGLVEGELAAFARLEQRQIQRMRAREALLTAELAKRYAAAVAGDKKIQDEIRSLQRASDLKCNEAREECEREVRAMTDKWEAERAEKLSALLETEAMGRGRAALVANTGRIVAAHAWRETLAPRADAALPAVEPPDATKEAAADPLPRSPLLERPQVIPCETGVCG